MVRARVRNSGPCLYPELLFCRPYSKPQYLIRDPLELLPSSPSSSDHADSSLKSSGPPSLESITDPKSPESGYEASNLASNSD